MFIDDCHEKDYKFGVCEALATGKVSVIHAKIIENVEYKRTDAVSLWHQQ